MSAKYQHVVVLSDTQYPFIHGPTESAIMEFVKDTKPDKVVQIGDFMDFYSLSSFNKKVPAQERLYLSNEIDNGREKLREWKSKAPKADWYLVAGNHEQRLDRYLEKHAPELFGLEDLTFERIMRLENAGWEYRGPYGTGMWLGQKGGIWATHGSLVRKWSGYTARGHWEKYGHSVIHGHTHRLGAFYHTNRVHTVGAFEVGCMCDPQKTPGVDGPRDWQFGFASVYVSNHSPRFHVDLIAVTNGSFVIHGQEYGV